MTPEELAAAVGELERLEAAATRCDIVYRPGEHDDWGLVRYTEPSPWMAELGFSYGSPHCKFSVAGLTDDFIDDCRARGVDPAFDDAVYYIALRNTALPIIRQLRAERDALAARVKELEAAHRPDDGEPVTEEYAMSLGIEPLMIGQCEIYIDAVSQSDSAIVMVRDANDGDAITIRVTTRGQLRSLLRGLGIVAKEAS